MPQYRITAPDGKQLLITAPDGATKEEVLAYAQQNYKPAATEPPVQPAAASPEEQGREAGQGVVRALNAGSAPFGDSTLGQIGNAALHAINPLSAAGDVVAGATALGNTAGLGLPEKAAGVLGYAGNRLTGGTDTLSDSMARAHGAVQGMAQEAPGADTAGTVGGFVLGGGAISDALKAAEKLPAMAGKVAQILNGTSTAARLGRGAAIGGTIAGVQSGGDPVETGLGAVLGGGGEAAAPLIIKGVGHLIEGPAQKAARVLAKFLGETPAKVESSIVKFRARTGRNPTAQEISTDLGVGQMRKTANELPDVGVAMTKADAASQAARKGSMDVAVQQTGRPYASQQIFNATKAQGDKDFAVVRDLKDIVLPPQTTKLIQEEVLPQLRLGNAKQDIMAGLEDNGSISGNHLEMIREALGRTARKSRDANIYDLNQQFLTELGNSVPDLRGAVQRYSEGMQLVRGAEHGENILGASKNHTNYMAEYAAMTPLEKEGARLGLRSALVDKAAAGKGQAEALASQLANDTSLTARIGDMLGPKEAQKLSLLGKMENTAAGKSRSIAPSFAGSESGVSAHDIAHGAAGLIRGAAGDVVGGAYHAGMAGKLIARLKVPPGARKILSVWLQDPKQMPKAISYMKRFGVTDAQLANAGLIAGDTAAFAGGSTPDVLGLQ